MNIKPLGVEDIDAIIKLGEGVFLDAWNYRMLKSSFESGRFFVYGCFKDDDLVGYVGFTIADVDADIEMAFVSERFRRRGIATLLINHVERDCKAKSVNKLFLEVRQTNEGGRRLYQGLGFVKISVRKRYYLDGEDAVVMVKEI